MSNNSHKFMLSVVAASVIVGISGCSMVPVNPDSRFGRATAVAGDVSGRVWKRTKHVFRIEDDKALLARKAARAAGESGMESDEFANPVDLALMDSNEEYPLDQDIYSDEQVVVSGTSEIEQPLAVATAEPQQIPAQTPELSLEEQLNIPLAQTRELTLRTDDYTHEVQPGESLWDLSRDLTGDARNWQVLAELNDLDANGSIRPGQTLHIPADMANGKGISHIATVTPLQENPVDAAAKPVLAAAKPANSANPKSKATDTVAEIAIAGKTKAEVPAAKLPKEPSTAFGVQAGETMWDLAKRTTGDATNWRKIAAANNMTESQAAKIRYGQNIDVPNDILKKMPVSSTELAANASDAGSSAKKTPVDAKPATTVVADATKDAAKRIELPAKKAEEQVAKAGDTAKEIEILPAKFQADPPKIDEKVAKKAEGELPKSEASAIAKVAEPAEVQPGSPETNSDWVMVSGTYYPKAVYNDANFSATLLMRVSPGTKLLVSRAIGPWYEVKTDRGIGYVHSRDVK